MKVIKLFALAIGAIALLPSVSLADNINGTSQDATLKSTTVGSGNVTVQDVKQHNINLQQSGGASSYHQKPADPCDKGCPAPSTPHSGGSGTNINGTAQKVNADAVTFGHGNVTVQQSVQDAINAQYAK